mgnify:CR=1 FL=1|jgi:uncharacterized protein YhbP (UPF0306 family)
MLQKKAKKIISDIIYINIATVSPEGKPWNSPVYSAFDENYNFYWASWKENEHSKNIVRNPDVFITTYDSTAPEGTGEGVYIQAKAYELTDPNEIEHATKYYYGRKNGIPRKIDEFLGEYPRRMYKAIPEKMWINDEGSVNGNYIDTRTEIDFR